MTTEAEFDELKRKDQEALEQFIKELREKHGWNMDTFKMHGNLPTCYCGCPNGPCQHVWDGPVYEAPDKSSAEITCSRCGVGVSQHVSFATEL